MIVLTIFILRLILLFPISSMCACSLLSDHRRYIPFNAVHNTVSTPKGWNETDVAAAVEGSVTMSLRKKFAGALFLMDQECRAIVDKLKERHLYVRVTPPINPIQTKQKISISVRYSVPCFSRAGFSPIDHPSPTTKSQTLTGTTG